MITLSVVIPCRHQAHFLNGLLKDLQSELEFSLKGKYEIIVVDDASEQDNPEAKLPDNGIQLIRTKTRVGVSAARNLGAKAALGQFLYFIDADDRIVRGSLQRAVHLLFESPVEPAIMGNLGGFIDNEGARLYPSNSNALEEKPEIKYLTYAYFRRGGRIFPNVARFIFSRERFHKLGGFASGLERAEDWDFILRWTKDSPVLLTPVPMFYYRIHEANGTVRIHEGRLKAHRKSLAAGKLVRMSHGLDVSNESL